MKFWEASYEIAMDDIIFREETVKIAAPKIYKKIKVIDIITKVHPEWKNITIKRCKKPENWLLFK